MEGSQISESSLKEERAVEATKSFRAFYEQEMKLHFVNTKIWLFVMADSISIVTYIIFSVVIR